MPVPIPVTLTPAEVLTAINVGVMRRLKAIEHNWQNRGGTEPTWDDNIVGALGELVLAKCCGVYWHPAVGELGRHDVGDLEVRTTPHATGHLTLNKWDKDGRYVLVTGSVPCYQVVGWIDASEGRQERWWRRMRPDKPLAYFVPQDVLRDMSELPW